MNLKKVLLNKIFFKMICFYMCFDMKFFLWICFVWIGSFEGVVFWMGFLDFSVWVWNKLIFFEGILIGYYYFCYFIELIFMWLKMFSF